MIFKAKDKRLDYTNKVLLMGIVNVTPDSFSDGGLYINPEKAVEHALQLIRDGADIIDLGAQSTRPGAQEITADEEWERLYPALKELRKKTDLPISVDTYFYSVAKKALSEGADIINDVSGLISKKMCDLIKSTGAGWVIMHNGAGGAQEVKRFFTESAKTLVQNEVDLDRICFDMGIGFGKSYEENLELIARVKEYKFDGVPLLLGVSRKTVIGTACGVFTPEDRTCGNVAADTAAIFGGVDIIRLHNIKEEKRGIKTAMELKKWIR